MNKQAAKDQNEYINAQAMRAEIEDIIRTDGPCTVAYISRATGFNPYTVRQHCEAMKELGEVSHNWVSGRYSV